jgi:hypothetical protein
LIGTTLEQPRGRFALTGGRIVLPKQVVTGQAIVIADGKIAGLTEAGALGSDVEKIDVGYSGTRDRLRRPANEYI